MGNPNVLTQDRGTSQLSQGPLRAERTGGDRPFQWPGRAGDAVHPPVTRGIVGVEVPPEVAERVKGPCIKELRKEVSIIIW